MAERPPAALSDLGALSALADPVRRGLYEAVCRARRPIGRDEAAQKTGISRKLAAYHLDKLAELGVLETEPERVEGRTGRPAKLYRRASRDFVLRTPPRDYRLLSELVVEAAADPGEPEIRAAIGRSARRLGRRLGEAGRSDRRDKRKTLMRMLRERGYEPVDEDAETVRLLNCPFHGVAQRFPDLVCGVNVELLRGVLEGLETDGLQATLDPREGACCVAIKIADA